MKKGFLISIMSLILISCGGSDDSKNESDKFDTLYLFQGGSSNLFPRAKTYQIKENKNLLVQDTSIEETSKYYLTQNAISTFSSPQLDQNTFLLGESATFDGAKLQYSVSNYIAERPLVLSYQYKKIDVSGQLLTDDIYNPIRQMNSSATGQILVAILGLGYSPNKVFPKGSICWQSLSANSSQEYIEFLPYIVDAKIFANLEIEATGNWSNVVWTRFKDKENTLYYNVKLTIDGKDYQGKYHPQNEFFYHKTDELTCNWMNHTAYKAVNQPFEK
ncbi:hypothetical protein [Acinetobacter bereziniae]|uniref:hypothetical protein n=1 Tax=Acinetobacter bereziniae TaxID=106648 RepID=UPI00124BE6A0|nr:hypothetical protein [Acinetobacter bereziniae]